MRIMYIMLSQYCNRSCAGHLSCYPWTPDEELDKTVDSASQSLISSNGGYFPSVMPPAQLDLMLPHGEGSG